MQDGACAEGQALVDGGTAAAMIDIRSRSVTLMQNRSGVRRGEKSRALQGETMRYCVDCAAPSWRQFLNAIAGGLATSALLYGGAGRAAGAKTTVTADQNSRQAEGRQRPLLEVAAPLHGRSRRRPRDAGQGPGALGDDPHCSDSRLAPEIIFGGLDFGELFVARNAGNVADVSA